MSNKCQHCGKEIYLDRWHNGEKAWMIVQTQESYCLNSSGGRNPVGTSLGHWHKPSESSIVEQILNNYDV